MRTASLPRLPSLLLWVVIAIILGHRPLSAAPAKPNVIVIVADDMGYADTGFNGCRDIPTPHLDRLARQGIRFTNGYVTHSFCSPSRAALLTGRYQQRFGHENNPVFLPHDPKVGLPLAEKMLPQVLRPAGYVSGHIGKWHLGAADVFHPLRRGFDESFGFLGGGHQYLPEKWTVDQPSQHADEYITKLQRNGRYIDEKEYLTDALSREAVAFVARHRAQPFFLYLAYNAPHGPLQATEKYLRRFPQLRDKRRLYAAMVSALDDGVGQVLAEVDKQGLTARTLIFFLSDNGGPTQVNGSSNAPLRGDKGSVYEGGFRVPFVVSWPGQLPAGRDYDWPVSSLDIFATATAQAGVDTTALALDGVDLLPYLTGKNPAAPHPVLYWRMGGGNAYAVRQGDRKLVEPRGGRPELYDLRRDLSERQDLASAQPEALAALERLKQAWNAQLVPPAFTGLESLPKKKKKAAAPD